MALEVATQFLEGFGESFANTLDRREKAKIAAAKKRAAAFTKAVKESQTETDTRADIVKKVNAIASSTDFDTPTVKNWLLNEAINKGITDSAKLEEKLIQSIQSGVLDPSKPSQLGDVSVKIPANQVGSVDIPEGATANTEGLITFPGQEDVQTKFSFFGDESDLPFGYKFDGKEGEAVAIKSVSESLTESGAIDKKAIFKTPEIPTFKDIDEFEAWRIVQQGEGTFSQDSKGTWDYNSRGLYPDGFANSIEAIENLLTKKDSDEKYESIFDLSTLSVGELSREKFSIILTIAEQQAKSETDATLKKKIADKIASLRKDFLPSLIREKKYAFEDRSKWTVENVDALLAEVRSITEADAKKMGMVWTGHHKRAALIELEDFKRLQQINDLSSAEEMLQFKSDDNITYMDAAIGQAEKILLNPNLRDLERKKLKSMISLAQAKKEGNILKAEEDADREALENSNWDNSPYNPAKIATMDGKDAENILAAIDLQITNNNNRLLNTSSNNLSKELRLRNTRLYLSKDLLEKKKSEHEQKKLDDKDAILDDIKLDDINGASSTSLLTTIDLITSRIGNITPQTEGGILSEKQKENKRILNEKLAEVTNAYEIKLANHADIADDLENVKAGEQEYSDTLSMLLNDTEAEIEALEEKDATSIEMMEAGAEGLSEVEKIKLLSLREKKEILERRLDANNSYVLNGTPWVAKFLTKPVLLANDNTMYLVDVTDRYTTNGKQFKNSQGQELLQADVDAILADRGFWTDTDQVSEITKNNAESLKDFTDQRLAASKQLKYLTTAYNIIDNSPGVLNRFLRGGKTIGTFYQEIQSVLDRLDKAGGTGKTYTFKEAEGLVRAVFKETEGMRELAFVALGIAYGVAGERGSAGMALSDKELRATINSLALEAGNPEEAKYSIGNRIKTLMANDVQRMGALSGVTFIKNNRDSNPFFTQKLDEYMENQFPNQQYLLSTIKRATSQGEILRYTNNFKEVMGKIEKHKKANGDPKYNRNYFKQLISFINENHPDEPLAKREKDFNARIKKELGITLNNPLRFQHIKLLNEIINNDNLLDDSDAKEHFYTEFGIDPTFFITRTDPQGQ